ncbi:MAG: T9SS type A sorting domain-containing protein, partial [Bacteroidales bacterium]|nr:T9SS type A sorting domain-containing protein [Bacteroidales bacterium]
IDLHFQKPPIQTVKHSLKDNQIRLTPFQASTNNLKKNHFPYVFTGWFHNSGELNFNNIYLETGKYTLKAEYSSWYNPLGGDIYFTVNGQTHTGHYDNTGNVGIPNDINNYISKNLMEDMIDIPVSNVYPIKITRNAEIPNTTTWINIRSLTLNKVQDGTTIVDRSVITYPTFVKNGYFVCESPFEQTIKIYDTKGRLRKTDTIGIYKKVDVSTFEPGLYIIKGENFVQKIAISNLN